MFRFINLLELIALTHIGPNLAAPVGVSVPFPVLADLSEVVCHPAWDEAFAAVRAGLEAGSPVLLSGAPGCGKSLLLRAIERALQAEEQTVVLLPGKGEARQGRPDVVLLDNADRVPPDLLRHLLGGASSCVLAGPHGLLEALNGPDAVTTVVELRSLSPGEVGPYLLQQVERAGLPPSLLGHGTLDALAQGSAGNPRQLQKLASRALFRAWIDNADQISVQHVLGEEGRDGSVEPDRPDAAAPETPSAPALHQPDLAGADAPGQLVTPRRAQRFRPWFGAAAAAAVCSVGIAFLLQPRSGPDPVATLPQAAVLAGHDRHAPPQFIAPQTATPGNELGPAPNPYTTVPPASGAVPVPPSMVAQAAVPVTQPAPPEPQDRVPAPVLRHPPTTPIHVVIGFAQADAAAGGRSIGLVGMLKDAGIDATLAVGPLSEHAAPVRYFYPADRSAAAQVARWVGEAGHEQMSSLRGTPPRPGTVQVLVPLPPTASRRSRQD